MAQLIEPEIAVSFAVEVVDQGKEGVAFLVGCPR